mmetsp:Transcript_13170/g.38749  ORF Transcript_13170/g.38749 Transcript_13170/m.38749 type:complete len:156 (+) Transcript_13170:83-550(+)
MDNGTGSNVLPRSIGSAEHVDQTLLAERQRMVLIRFGRGSDPSTVAADVILNEIAHELWLYCVIYLVDIDEVPHFTGVFELYDPCTIMCFYRNHTVPIDLGHGPDVKLTWPFDDGQILVEAIENACQRRSNSHASARRTAMLVALQGLFFNGAPL